VWLGSGYSERAMQGATQGIASAFGIGFAKLDMVKLLSVLQVLKMGMH